ncbi:MAG: NPCBM/NEW2 domain-containing protein [Armatimonadetes bacterium]|nr:NPCBM/NEW2 domain-containing protein [Armatimonadota bacterium]
MRKIILLFAVCLVCACEAVTAEPSFYKFAQTPPMGWNSWDCFGTGVNEEQTRANADYMAKYLLKFGWQYVVVDIEWYLPTAGGWGYVPNLKPAMDDNGRLLPAPNRFPSAVETKGFKPLADYCHAKGLKFGVHLLRGIERQAVEQNTPILGTNYHAADVADKNDPCPWNPDMWGVNTSKPGAQEYYDSVFKLFAEWEVDFVKVDDLSAPYHKGEVEAIRKAIDKCGRPIVFSTSPGDTPLADGESVSANANMWRISGDFWDNWSALKGQFDRCDKWTPFRAPGHWPDADMLPLGAVRQPDGWTAFTLDEQYTVMTLWSICQSPLMFGGHLPKNDDFTLALITNPEVLDVNQHSSGGKQLYRKGDMIAWVADVPNSKDKYLALFNAASAPPLDMDKAAFKSDLVTRETPGQAVDIDIDITGAKKLLLVVDVGGDDFSCDHTAWAEPRLIGPNGEKKLTDLQWVSATSGWGKTAINKNVNGSEIIINDKPVAYGIGAHSPSLIEYDLPAGYTRFKASAGLERSGVIQNGGATVKFFVFTSDPRPAGATLGIPIPVKLSDLGFSGFCKIRDLWAHKDLGKFKVEFAPSIRFHGAGLYRVTGVR